MSCSIFITLDPNAYNKIHANLCAPFTQFSTLVIDSLTTTACFEVLNGDDYIVVGGSKITFNDNYSSLNANTVSTLLNGPVGVGKTTLLNELSKLLPNS